ncbi:hypothetical protein OH807_19505 [Kitasatospora sp. NBC_01560]|uniref:hypothetical protein n=1 Tax=Kitasatospora sp. NBC_01560 TaxID=2975965 RepID=UPI00386C8B06
MDAVSLTMAPWQRPSDAELVQLGLDALMADVEAPSLALLAGLARGEYSQARELFALVLDELGLLPLTAEDLAEARWTAARWWAGLIVARRLDPVEGATLIHEAAAAELGYPDALQPLADLAQEIVLLDEQPPDQHLRERIESAVRDFLATEAGKS